MDEPFGAIDPVTRARLQDEFLRIQREIAKTIVFVTHDIDEAVKMGDRIAILEVGGVLAQYDVPAEVLGQPGERVRRGLRRRGPRPEAPQGDADHRRRARAPAGRRRREPRSPTRVPRWTGSARRSR